jgi:hypothetical protein
MHHRQITKDCNEGHTPPQPPPIMKHLIVYEKPHGLKELTRHSLGGGMVQAWVAHFVTPLKRKYNEYD